MTLEIVVNSGRHTIEEDPSATLLETLRQLQFLGAKESCGVGECGACTVLMNGKPVLSCVTLVHLVDGPVETIEGLADELRPLREAFAKRGGFQCGYCTPGQLMAVAAVVRSPDSDLGDALYASSATICRCTGYQPIRIALQDVFRAQGQTGSARFDAGGSDA